MESFKVFVNEIGNLITITVQRQEKGEVRIIISGPTSTTENTVTEREARVLMQQLSSVLPS